MKLIEREGDLVTDEHAIIIAHVVNCQGAMGSGIAGQIRATYPEVYEAYIEGCKRNEKSFKEPEDLLGQIQMIKNQPNRQAKIICNMFAQNKFGKDGKRYLNYEALYICLEKFRNLCGDYANGNYSHVIGFPKNLGCGLAGGDWEIVKAMIVAIFKDSNFEIHIVEKKS